MRIVDSTPTMSETLKVFVYSVEPPINTGFRRKDWTKVEIYSKVKFVFQGHQRGSSASGVGAGTPGYARGARPGPERARPNPAGARPGPARESAPGARGPAAAREN